MAKDRGGCLEIATLRLWRRRAWRSSASPNTSRPSAVPALVEQARADEPQEADTAGDRPASERARFTKGHLDRFEGLDAVGRFDPSAASSANDRVFAHCGPSSNSSLS